MAPGGLTASVLFGLLVTVPNSGAAQHLSPTFAQAQPVLTPRVGLPADSAAHGDFRWPGTAIGAAGLGLAASLEARAYCGNSESGPRDCTGFTIGVGLLGAAVGGAVGHLVGRAIHR